MENESKQNAVPDKVDDKKIRELLDTCLKELLEKFKGINEFEYINKLENLLNKEKKKNIKLTADNKKLKKALSKLLDLDT